jgi:hypothetical protein
MRILVQRRDSGLYLEDIRSWTPDSSAAMDFVSSTAALDFCAANKVEGVQLVLKFDAEKREIVLPAMTSQTAPDQRPGASA